MLSACTLWGQAKKPIIMVIPSDAYCNRAGYVTTYQDANGNWQPVEEPDGYPIAKGEPCTVNFKPVKTKSLKLEVTINKRLSGGVFEWIVK